MSDRVPDARTIWLFREKLTKAGAIGPLFERFDATLRQSGVPAFSSYRYRNLVERFFNKIKHYRAVATRYDNFLAGVNLASLRIWMRFYESMD